MARGSGAWVCGFAFYRDMVLFIDKKHGPDIVVGRLNGLGGSIESGESPRDAMVREFKEESGVLVTQDQWREFAVLEVPAGNVFMFTAQLSSPQFSGVGHYRKTTEDERLLWVCIDKLRLYNVVQNIGWLVHMALDPQHIYCYTRSKA